MKSVVRISGVLGLLALLPALSAAGPEQDRERFVEYFTKKFSDVPVQEFRNGVYSIDQVSRDSWEAIEDFPPYEPFIDEGEAMNATGIFLGATLRIARATGASPRPPNVRR